MKGVGEEEEDEEDMDALIEELESQDAAIDYEDEEVAAPGGARVVPEDLLQTDTRMGLTSSEVTSRRKKFGMNQMKGA
jgi:H+-transporting ATPase